MLFYKRTRALHYDGIMNRYDLLSPGEQEDDEGEDGRGEYDLPLGVQPLLVVRAGAATAEAGGLGPGATNLPLNLRRCVKTV